jgi:DNA-binding NarL/FixJ family response regulator
VGFYSPIEQQVLELMADGFTNRQIADRLKLTQEFVESVEKLIQETDHWAPQRRQ